MRTWIKICNLALIRLETYQSKLCLKRERQIVRSKWPMIRKNSCISPIIILSKTCSVLLFSFWTEYGLWLTNHQSLLNISFTRKSSIGIEIRFYGHHQSRFKKITFNYHCTILIFAELWNNQNYIIRIRQKQNYSLNHLSERIISTIFSDSSQWIIIDSIRV